VWIGPIGCGIEPPFSVNLLAPPHANYPRCERAQTDTFIIRAALDGEASIYRDIEIEASQSLYKLAEVIVSAFDFDHAFGFYSGSTLAAMRKHPRYELFVDMGEADPGAHGVKKSSIAQAFPIVGHSVLFLFDYGDDWRFRVKLKATEALKARYLALSRATAWPRSNIRIPRKGQKVRRLMGSIL
jgi:hypothetical protein